MRGVVQQMDGWHRPKVLEPILKRFGIKPAPTGRDQWHPAWFLIAASPLLVWLVPRQRRGSMLWLILTIAIYVSGYLLVYFDARYVWFVLLPLSILLSIALLLGIQIPRPWTVAQMLAAALLLIGFAIGAEDAIEKRMESRSPIIYRRIAQGIRTAGLKGPIAGNHALKSYPIAMHLDEKFLLFPLDDDIDVIEKKLRDAKTGILLVWGSARPSYEPENVEKNIGLLVKRPTWKRVEIPGAGGAEIYVPVN